MMTQSDRSAVVLDTNVVSILYERDSPGHEFCYESLRDRRKLVSFITEYEIRWGIERSGWSSIRKQRVLNDLRIYQVVWGRFYIVRAAVELMARCRHQPPSFPDLFIASTAYAHNCPLVTDDKRLAEQLSAAGFHNVITRHSLVAG